MEINAQRKLVEFTERTFQSTKDISETKLKINVPVFLENEKHYR